MIGSYIQVSGPRNTIVTVKQTHIAMSRIGIAFVVIVAVIVLSGIVVYGLESSVTLPPSTGPLTTGTNNSPSASSTGHETGSKTISSSTACQESTVITNAINVTLNVNEDTPVQFTIYGVCHGLSMTNLTVDYNSNLNMTFPQNILANGSEYRLDYICSRLQCSTVGPNCPTGVYGPAPCNQMRIPNVTADKDTSMNYSLWFFPPFGYIQTIQPNQTLTFTVQLNSEFRGSYTVELKADSVVQERFNVTVA